MLIATAIAMRGSSEPACQGNHAHARNDRSQVQYVSHQVVGIRLKRNRPVLAPGLISTRATAKLIIEANTETTKPSPICRAAGGDQPADSRPHNRCRGEQDQSPSSPLEKYSALLWP